MTAVDRSSLFHHIYRCTDSAQVPRTDLANLIDVYVPRDRSMLPFREKFFFASLRASAISLRKTSDSQEIRKIADKVRKVFFFIENPRANCSKKFSGKEGRSYEEIKEMTGEELKLLEKKNLNLETLLSIHKRAVEIWEPEVLSYIFEKVPCHFLSVEKWIEKALEFKNFQEISVSFMGHCFPLLEEEWQRKVEQTFLYNRESIPSPSSSKREFVKISSYEQVYPRRSIRVKERKRLPQNLAFLESKVFQEGREESFISQNLGTPRSDTAFDLDKTSTSFSLGLETLSAISDTLYLPLDAFKNHLKVLQEEGKLRLLTESQWRFLIEKADGNVHHLGVLFSFVPQGIFSEERVIELISFFLEEKKETHFCYILESLSGPLRINTLFDLETRVQSLKASTKAYFANFLSRKLEGAFA